MQANQSARVASGHEQGIDGVANMAEREIPVQSPIGFYVTDCGLDMTNGSSVDAEQAADTCECEFRP